jgi:hypothetical protein
VLVKFTAIWWTVHIETQTVQIANLHPSFPATNVASDLHGTTHRCNRLVAQTLVSLQTAAQLRNFTVRRCEFAQDLIELDPIYGISRRKTPALRQWQLTVRKSPRIVPGVEPQVFLGDDQLARIDAPETKVAVVSESRCAIHLLRGFVRRSAASGV